MRVLVTSSTGDTISVEVRSGSLSDPDSLVYVDRRGLFEVMRVELRVKSRIACKSNAR